MDLGTRIKILRESAGLSQIAFAKSLNISNSALSQYESGARVPSDATKIKIADHFNVSLDYLMGRTEQRRFPRDRVSSKLSDTEGVLIRSFRQLNGDGQRRIVEHMEDLVASGRYSKDTKTKTSA